MPLDEEWLEAALLKDDARRRLVRARILDMVPALPAGENYTSTIFRMQVAAVLGTGKEIEVSLIVKEMITDGAANDFLLEQSTFKTEIKMYEEILPLMEDVLSEQSVPPIWPRFIGKNENYLIFEDLKSKNYKLADRCKRMDLYHSTLVVRSMALFHSASIVLKERGQLDVSDLAPTLFLRDSPEIRKLNVDGIRTCANIIINEWGPEWKEIGERLLVRSRTIFEDVRQLAEVNEERLNVLCHGDPWTTNMLFKYSKATDLPIGVRFLDFQISHYNSFAFDLLYFMASGLPPEVRRTCRSVLLESYTKVLTDSLEFYGLKHLAPSLSSVEKEVKRLELYYFVMIFTLMPVTSTSVKDAFSFDGLREGSEGPYNPDIYRGDFRHEVDQELLQWANEGLL